MNSLEWDDFRLVKTIAEHRALGPAAEALKLNHSTIFRKLNTLEEQLGMRVFERSRSGYVLTVPGEEMLTIASQMADAVQDFERRAAGMDARPSGELRVTTTDTIFSHLLAPIFASFRAAYPGITLDVLIENRALNLSRRDADVAIRAAAEPPDTLVGRRLGQVTWTIYGKRALAFEKAAAILEADLPWVGFGDPVAGATAGRWFAGAVLQSRVILRVNNVSSMAAAIQGGIGIGMLPCFVGDQMPDLERLSAPIPQTRSELWILTHPDLRRSVRMRAFLDFVGTELSRNKKLIEGEGTG